MFIYLAKKLLKLLNDSQLYDLQSSFNKLIYDEMWDRNQDQDLPF